MARIVKYFLYVVGGLLVLLLVAGITFSLIFDPNDYRENISEQVRKSTGRDLVIEGDLDLSIFPWLAVDIGKSQLGNAEGFGDEPFASFDSARLSVRLMPLLLRREIVIGTAELESLDVNLEVNARGVSNWQDLADASEAGAAGESDDGGTAPGGALDIAGIEIRSANLSYDNAQLNQQFSLTNLNITTGDVRADEPIDISGGFDFEAQPADTSGTVSIESAIEFNSDAATIAFEGFSIDGSVDGIGETPNEFSVTAPAIELKTEERVASLGQVEISLLDVDLAADVAPFSYAASPTPTATISVAAFSPRSVAQRLGIDLPETADPSALGKLIVDAKAAVGENTISLSELVLVLDETTFRGELIVPRASSGTYRMDLTADSIELDRYMSPAAEGSEAAAGADAVPVEIPAELIRSINARGNLTLERGTLGNMLFENVVVGLNSANRQARIHPISAEFFDGVYKGDVRIDARENVPVLSVNEQIQGVSLAALGKAMLERNNLSGSIDGNFQLSGRGHDMAQVQRTLGGNMSFTLKDGVWEGVDIWYQLRRARAAFRKEAPPEPELPARTRFSEVRATSRVTNGIMQNDDFFAELPFMQMNGRGTVNLPEATVDYSLSGRVLEKPELVNDLSPEELDDLTATVIPLRITGPLAEPSIGIDFEALLRERVKDEIEDTIKDKLEDLFKR
jgi:AsmA protein